MVKIRSLARTRLRDDVEKISTAVEKTKGEQRQCFARQFRARIPSNKTVILRLNLPNIVPELVPGVGGDLLAHPAVLRVQERRKIGWGAARQGRPAREQICVHVVDLWGSQHPLEKTSGEKLLCCVLCSCGERLHI